MLDYTNSLIKLASRSFLPTNMTTCFSQADIKILKRAGITIPKNVDYLNFIKSRDFFVISREKALQLLTLEL